MTTRYGAATVMLLAALSVAGCGDDEPEVSGPPPTASEPASPSSAPASAEPQLTPEQVVKAWYDAYNVALQTGDMASADALVAEGCSTCAYELDPIREVYAAGGTYRGGTARVASVRSTKENGARSTVLAAVVLAAGKTKTEAGARWVSYDEERFIVEIGLRSAGGKWRIGKIVYLS